MKIALTGNNEELITFVAKMRGIDFEAAGNLLLGIGYSRIMATSKYDQALKEKGTKRTRKPAEKKAGAKKAGTKKAGTKKAAKKAAKGAKKAKDKKVKRKKAASAVVVEEDGAGEE
jgi:uncharacterized Ntn-hydrolase superfamily protein